MSRFCVGWVDFKRHAACVNSQRVASVSSVKFVCVVLFELGVYIIQAAGKRMSIWTMCTFCTICVPNRVRINIDIS